ncbi:LD-carboxypeptidase [candidate division KSB1 bacterium]
MVLKPLKLRASDLIGVISPGSPVNPEYLEEGIRRLQNLGFRVVTGRYATDTKGYLAGEDDNRLADLHEMFENPDIKMIMLARGGYGCMRLIENLDYKLIANNPKILTGFSDATALQFAIFEKTGMVSFSGPMVETNFGRNDLDDFAEKHFQDMVTGNTGNSFLPEPVAGRLGIICHGKAEGTLICGCLSVILGLLDTEYCPDLDGAILVIEDVSEPPYKIDRAIYTLKIHRVFEKISGLVLGSFVDCESDNEPSVDEIIKPVAEEYGIPVMKNLSYGHIPGIMTIPFGVKARLNTENGKFELAEIPVN